MNRSEIDPDRCLWAVLTSEQLRLAGLNPGSITRRRERLEYMAEESFPLPAEDLLIGFERAGDSVIACALPRAIAAESTSDTHWLGPSGWPAWLSDHLPAARRPPDINLLVGSDEPPALRRARRRAVLTAASAATLLLALLVAGLERRTTAQRALRDDALRQRDAVHTRLFGDAPSSRPHAARMIAELRTLERLRSQPSQTSATHNPVTDAPVALAAALARFPPLPMTTEAIEAGPEAIIITANLASTEDAQRLAAAFERTADPHWPWRLRQPQVTGGAGSPLGTRATIRLEPVQRPGAATPESTP